ncbi:hypothetical protein SJA_C1-31910 [Sphingobium indicum UT26S]|uniref:Uncharacterized protein n=1 Tax=Sphingobium indicum (strain DSM 16413 / CCM 7287 / MTCC 6362 / UT26 / NBRC 101211 / UT26S) TaxID=452662 RepID=D4Z5Z3_SPHIU|nr:hypothetical protein SJA_C1-31910 [Sphingobium indicum UT26S]
MSAATTLNLNPAVELAPAGQLSFGFARMVACRLATDRAWIGAVRQVFDWVWDDPERPVTAAQME